MERNVKQVLSGVGFYGTLAVCLAVVGVCGWVLLRGEGTEPVQELPVTPQAAVSQPVTVPERVEEPVAETLKPEPVPVDTADKPEMPELRWRTFRSGTGSQAHCGAAAGRGSDRLFHGGANLQPHNGRLAHP